MRQRLRRGSRFPFKASDFVSLAEARNALARFKNTLDEIDRALKTPVGRDPAGL